MQIQLMSPWRMLDFHSRDSFNPCLGKKKEQQQQQQHQKQQKQNKNKTKTKS